MSSKRTFQCFNAVGGECIHKSSPPFEHHSSRFPRIPQHGIVAHHEPLEECYHCSECRHAQALEALETQAPSLYNLYTPYLHHHPQQYVLSRPTRPEENPAVHSGYNHHIHHHRYKRVVLVKNSDPSFRRTIILHRRSLHSFGLFLEEVSELMQYHIRKVYTLEGHKIDNIQGLLQYSGVLICVGREPSHPSIVENLRKGLTDKLPRLNVRSRSDGCSKGREGLPNNNSSISPKLVDEPTSHRQSVSSDKMLPDRTDSVNNTDSCPNTSDGTREDDVEKRVRVNKDGSLSMEMKVRFRLQNKETLQWSTKVRKTTGKSNDYFGRPNFAQVSDITYSESENISGCEEDEAYSDRHYQRRAEEPQHPHCYRHCQEYDIWKNIPGGHGASCCIQTSGSSASSHTVVSKKRLVERQTMSRSSEEHTEHVVESETCVETVEMAKTVETEYCSIRSETHSPSYTVESSVIETCEVNSSPNEVNAKTVQTPGRKQQMESAPYASSEDQNDDASASDSSAKMEAGSHIQQISPGRMSNASESSSHKRKSKKLYACKCKVSKGLEGETKGQIMTQAEDVYVERDQSSAMSVKSSKSKEAQNMEFGDAVVRRSESAMSVHSNASKSVVTDVTAEEAQDVPERPSSSASVHSSISTKTINSDRLAGKDKSQEDVDVEQSLSSMSLVSTKSKGSRVSVQSDKEQAVETEERAASALSATSTASTYSKPSNGQYEENAKEDNQDQSRASSDKADNEEMLESVERSPSTTSAKSMKSNTSLRSRKSGASDLPSSENQSENKESERPFSAMSTRSIKSEASARSRQSKRSESHTKRFDISDDGNKSENEERPQSGMSVKSAKSTVSVKSTLSSISAKSTVSKQADISAEESGAEHTETKERALSNMSTVSKSSALSKKSTGSAVPSHTCDDAPVLERDGDICDHNENAERAPSNLSVRSGKSSKSNISAMSRRSKVSELVLEDGGDSPEEIMVERESEGRALSSADRTPSALSAKSAKSNASTKSVKSNASQACCESQERAQSATSAKTAKSTISAKSSKGHDDQPEENRSDQEQEEQEERSTSSISIRSGNSAKSNVSTSSGRSNVSEVPLQDLLDNPNEGIDEVESMGRPVSSLSTQSVRSNISKRSKKSDSSAHESPNEENSKKQTEGRASSVQSHVSEVSEERAHSAQASTRSVKSNVAAVCSSRAIGSPNEGDGEEVSQERAQSAMSTKTTKSTISAKSSKSKIFEGSSEHCDRAPSNMSVRSAKSAKSNVSAASMKSQTSNVLTADHTDDSCEEMKEEEFTESRSASLLSVHSAKSSVKSRGSKCSADVHESSITRPRSRTSTASMKSEIPPDSETPEVRNDEEDIQDRAQSAMSAKSSISDVSSSVRSKTSKCASDVPTEESFENPNGENDREQRQRAASSISIQSHVSERSVNSQASGSDVAENKKTAERTASSLSKKSARSHVSGRSKSNASEVVYGFSDNENDEEKTQERAQSGVSASSTRSTMSVKSSKSKIDVPAEDYGSAHHRPKERPESAQSDRSAKSFTSTLSRRSKDTIASERTAEEEIGSHMSFKSDNSVEVDAESETETRSPSNRSVESAKSHISVSSRSTCEVRLEQADNGETVQRSPSSLSVRSARSAKSTQSVNSKASKRSKNSKVSEAPVKESMNTNEEITEDSEARPGSSMSAKSNRSNVTSISTKSNRSHNVDCKQDVGNEAQKQAPSFTKSLMSTGKSSPSKNTENTGECDETETGSSMSNKSVKSDLSQRSKNSKVSGQTPNTHSELDRSVERTPSVLSGKTHISAKSVESSVSLITPSDRSGNEETDARAHSEISTTESPCTTEEVNAEEKSNRAKSAMSTKSNLSVRSRKSKVSDVVADENIHDKEGRILSPVSAKSLRSEVLSCPEIPAVMVEESQDRASTKSKVSVHSEVSTSKNTERKSNGRPQSSLSVKSSISVKSTKSKDNLTDEYGKGNEEIMTPTETDISAEETISVNVEEDVIPSTRSLHEDGKQDEVDKKSCHSKTSKSNRQRRKNVNAEIYKPKSVADSAESDTSKKEQQLNVNKRCVICHTESVETDLSQTLSCSKIVKDTGEIPQPKSNADAHRSVTDNKSDKSSKSKRKSKNGDDNKLVPSNLPNTSPTEVVNEWLKKIPADGEMYDMEGLSENCDGQKNNYTTDEREKGTYDSSAAENTTDETEGDVLNTVPNMDCQTSQEEPNVDNTHEEGNGPSNIFNSSIQVMKVLLNPKIDRCNSLPEISPVYGRKLSTSARGLLDCLVKLQLIDTNPNNANEKDERYQELMNILQSLWLCVPQESEQELRRDHHCFVDDECNHTSSSGVDVNSGSAGSGKSSDGVNADAPQLHTAPDVFNEVQEACEGKVQPDAQWPHERENKGICHNEQKEDDQATNDTIRSNDSPSPASSNKSSGSDSGGKIPPEEIETDGKMDTSYKIPSLVQKPQLPKRITQDPDPVWVLTLLTKIEKQFMTHYVNAMREFKVRWQLDDNEQLDGMINELKNEVQKRIQRSIDRELKKIQIRVGLPRPPKEAISRSAATQPEERRRRLKMTLKRSTDSQANKSDDSATCTSYSDQRSENDDEYCPCETCIKKKMTSRPLLSTEAQKSAPVLADFNLKNILAMKTCDPNKTEANNCTSYSGSEAEICAAGKLVENVIVNAVKDVEGDGTENGIDEEESAAETVKAVATGNIEMAVAESATAEDDMIPEDISAEHRTVKEQVIEAGEVERDDEDGTEELSVEPAEEAASKDMSETGRENADTGEEELMEEVAQAVTTGDVNAAEETNKAAIDKNDCDIEETETVGGEEEIRATEANNSFDEASNITIEDELKDASEATIAEKEDATAMSATSEHESDKEDNMVEAETADESWRKQAATIGGEIEECEATDETAAEEAAMAALCENEPGKDDGDKEGNVGTEDEDEIAATAENELSEEAAEATTPEDGNAAEEVEVALPSKQESDEVVSAEEKMVELTSNNAADSVHEKDETTTADESERSTEDESREEVAEEKIAAEETPLAVLSEHESGKDDNEEAETVNDEDETAELNEEAAEAIAAEGENADAGEMGSTSKQEPYEEMAIEEEMTYNKELTDNSVNEKSETTDEAEKTAGATSEDEAAVIKDDSSATEDESREERAEDGISVGDTTGADLVENESENEQTGKETLATTEVESVDEKKDTSINDDSSEGTGCEAETTAAIAEDKDHPVISEEEQKEEVQTEDDNAAENVTDTSEDESDEEASAVARAVEEVEADTTTDSGEDATSNEDAPAEEPKEPVDEATSEDELIVEKEFAVESEDGFQDEDPEATAADDEMDLTKDKSTEDYPDDETQAESESEHEEGTGKESLTTSADDSADENNETATADRSSKGTAGKPESEDEIDDDKENGITSEDDSVEDAPSNVECAAEENDATGNDLTKETSEEAITENELETEKEFGIKTEDEPEKETTELTIDKDDTAEESSTIAVTDEHESDKVEAAEMSDDEEKLSVTSTDESADDTFTDDKDVDKAESEDETAPDKDQDEPKKETANDEIRSVESAKDATTELQSDEEPMEDESVKDEDTTAISNDDSAENATANEDGTESDCTDNEQPKATEAAISEDESTGDNEIDTDEFKDESAETNNVEDKNTVEETDIAAITEDEAEMDEAVEAGTGEELEQNTVNSEEENAEGKDTVATHEDEDEGSTEKDEEGNATADNEVDRDTDVEATSSEESEPHETKTAKKAAAEAEIALTSEDEIKEETDEATVAEADTTEQDPLEEEETEACDNAEDTAVSREDDEHIGDEGTDNPAEAATSEDEVERKDGITTNEENAKEEDTEGAKETGNSSDEESGALVEGQECECEHSKSQQEEVTEGEMAGEQSEEDDESAGKSIRAGEDCTEVATTEDEVEEHEGIGEPETMGNGAIEREESADYSADESAEDNRQQVTEAEVQSENAASESGTNPDEDETNKQTDVTEEHQENHITVRSDETNGADDVVGVKPGEDEDEGEEEESKVGSHVNDGEDAIKASNNEEVEAQTAKETWSAIRGDSADAEDEADDSDGSDRETNDSETEEFVTNKADHQEAAKKPQQTFVLKKVSAESEDGAYGDAEDSETEMNSSEEPNKPGVKEPR